MSIYTYLCICLGGAAYCASLYSAPPCKLDRVESLYGGTKSLYAKSPPLTRANLNRSQSVYTKSSGPIVHRGEGNYNLFYIQRCICGLGGVNSAFGSPALRNL